MKCVSKVNIETITPDDGYHYFFGYYDLQPYDKKSERHLAHRVKFVDRLPTAEDIAELGYITLKDKQFHKVAESRAWNFQQGTLMQWFDDDSIIYNDFIDGDYRAVIKNVNDGSERIICKPLACLSEDRKYGISINFPRIFNFRPGYGYCNTVDEFKDVNAPEEDGIFLIDIENNTEKLIINYKQLSEAFPEKPFCEMKLVVNHITFNPSASRFLFLLRNFPEEGKRWGTILITADRDGGNMRNLTNYEVNSHYHWKNDEEIIIFSGLPEWGIYFFNDKTGERTMLQDGLVSSGDIHCIYSGDRSCFIGDGYPDAEDYRHMFIYDMESGKGCDFAKIYSHPVSIIDIRCDLHNRFDPSNKFVSFDSYHTERREICQFNFDKAALLENA
ncbi:MAG: hypothetical protein IJO96_02590 [Oscillospiraceae bacterium]|nr:hypothetical protein [Oscillospiraceae bacterium]